MIVMHFEHEIMLITRDSLILFGMEIGVQRAMFFHIISAFVQFVLLKFRRFACSLVG